MDDQTPDAPPPTEPVDESIVAPTPAPDGIDTTAPAPARRRPSRRTVVGWSVGVGALLLVAGGVAVVQVSANETFDAAYEQLSETTDAGAEAATSLEETTADAQSSLASANEIAGTATDELVDSAARSAFVATIDTTAAGAASAEALLADGVDDGAAEKPFWPWELWDAASALDDRSASADDVAREMDAAETQLDAADADMLTAAEAVYASAPAAAAAIEAANVSAKATIVLDLREAADAVASQTIVGSGASVAFTTYVQRAQAIKDSNAAELAEKAGPLEARRLEIEAYARSISGGVVLDFDWAPIVAGVGGSTGIGGTATWNSIRGGFSTITLSNSVAERWPSADSRALVAHEVGHSITSKCHEKFDSENQEANEEWATAWAISMGHTSDANGVQAYGYPSQTMIDAAATCR